MSPGRRAELYARLPVTPAVDWWCGLAAASSDGRVLELGAGTGRLTARLVEVAKVTAVDVDAPSLAFLRQRVPAASAIEADVRDLALGEQFGVVLLPVALLNEVGDLAARRSTLACAARHLAPEGVLACEILNPLWLLAGGESAGTIEGDPEPVQMVAAHQPGDVFAQAVRANLTYRFSDGAVLNDQLDAHAVFPAELELLLAEVGLEITAAYGSDPVAGDSPTEDDGSWYVTAARAEG